MSHPQESNGKTETCSVLAYDNGNEPGLLSTAVLSRLHSPETDPTLRNAFPLIATNCDTRTAMETLFRVSQDLFGTSQKPKFHTGERAFVIRCENPESGWQIFEVEVHAVVMFHDGIIRYELQFGNTSFFGDEEEMIFHDLSQAEYALLRGEFFLPPPNSSPSPTVQFIETIRGLFARITALQIENYSLYGTN